MSQNVCYTSVNNVHHFEILTLDDVNSPGPLRYSAVSADKANSQRGINMVIVDGK